MLAYCFLSRISQKRTFETYRLDYEFTIAALYKPTKSQLIAILVISKAQSGLTDRGENTIMTGATDGGSSFLAYALEHKSCNQAGKVAYLSLRKLLNLLKTHKIDGSFRKEAAH